ncbi:FAD-dependent monooxygenase [Streptomyces fragilis]|uniref:FAD-dependent monooxygenase n=1 Tax=Streptomyces fragilis TaxID=67301 RepID=A0ABV2YGZ5_9ACTN|nr:FAD-dependent monooxygenase [Streptomyces fragilis]
MTTMHGTTPHPADDTSRSVVVVGAGPTGLLLAGDLAEAGVPVTLVEKRPHRVSNLSRALVVHARTLEQLDARGLADELAAIGRPLGTLRLFGRLSLELGALPSRFPYVLVVPQYEVERLLERRAAEAGVRFAHEREVTGLRQDADGVEVAVRAPGGVTEALRAAYVVGTDGAHSVVRDLIGLPFPGRSVIRSLVLADVRLTEDPGSVLTADAGPAGFALVAPFGDGYHRVTGWRRGDDRPDSDPVGLEEVREIVRGVLGTDFGMHDPRWMSRIHSDERQAPSYRVGRVLLAGDAAHVHSPAGGQGMNTGLQDAANLGWKLAAVLGGHAAPALLDTYQAERHPVGRMVLLGSGALIRGALVHGPAARLLRATALDTASRVGPVWRRGTAMVSGIGIRYRRPRGAHRVVGARVPDVPLAGGGRLYEALRGGRFVLLTPPGLEAAPGSERLAVVRWAAPRGTAVLVRPDGYAAWAAETATAEQVRAALREHVG